MVIFAAIISSKCSFDISSLCS